MGEATKTSKSILFKLDQTAKKHILGEKKKKKNRQMCGKIQKYWSRNTFEEQNLYLAVSKREKTTTEWQTIIHELQKNPFFILSVVGFVLIQIERNLKLLLTSSIFLSANSLYKISRWKRKKKTRETNDERQDEGTNKHKNPFYRKLNDWKTNLKR